MVDFVSTVMYSEIYDQQLVKDRYNFFFKSLTFQNAYATTLLLITLSRICGEREESRFFSLIILLSAKRLNS